MTTHVVTTYDISAGEQKVIYHKILKIHVSYCPSQQINIVPVCTWNIKAVPSINTLLAIILVLFSNI